MSLTIDRPFWLASTPRPAPSSSAALAVGHVVAGRFRVQRLLGAGGTGEVYAAEDLVLHAEVALKVLRPDAADEAARERLHREVLLARRVTHPHVCRVFDLYEAGDRAGGVGPLLLTMELVRGETLAALVARRGSLPPAEALPLARQMAAGLGAAHRAGVVHRDFKCANVVIAAGADGGTRAVVTDFGLARALEGGDASSSRSAPLVGTCAYMSPEQVAGEAVGASADIYALGVVLYEMVTGRRPFQAGTALATALQRMHEPPPPPTRFAPDLDPRWEAVILRCLARDPRERFARPEDVAAALEAAAPPSTRTGRRPRVAVLLAAAALSSFGAAGRAWPRLTRLTGPRTSAPAQVTATHPRAAVALLGFTNLSGRAETAWLSTALAEMLATDLSTASTIRTIPGEEVARMKADLALSDADTLAGDTLARVRANVGADYVVLGSYRDLGPETGGRIRVDLRLQDAATGGTVVDVSEMGVGSDLPDLVSRLGARLREGLGAGATRAMEARSHALPANPAALELYAEGLAALRLLDGQGAERFLQRAVDLEPGSPLVHTALAEAWTAVGSDRRARQEAEKAFELSASLPEEERRWIEGRYREAVQDWAGAVQAYRALWSAFPDNGEYGLRLAAVQTSMGAPREALATLSAMRERPRSMADDPRIDLMEAEARLEMADFQRARQLSAAAADEAMRQGARRLLAHARLQEARALDRLGDARQAAARYTEAQRFFAATGDRASVSWTNVWLGFVRFSAGEPEEARALFARALDGFEALGHRRGRGAALNHLAMVHLKQGRLTQAEAIWNDALAIYREVDDRAGVARVSNNLAVLAHRQGELARSQRLYEETVSISRQVGDKRTLAVALANMGDIDAERGELRGAEKLYQESLTLVESIGFKRNVGVTLSHLGNLRLQMGDLDGARGFHERALSVHSALGAKLPIAESRLDLGRVALEGGRAREAERAARSAREEFRREHAVDDETLAQALLASALAAQGKEQPARLEAQRTRTLAAGSENQLVRLTGSIAAARVDVASSVPAEVARGRRSLEAVVAEAGRSGRRGIEMEARLALLQSGAASDANIRREAAALGKEAKSLDYGLVLRQTAALAASPGGGSAPVPQP